MRANLPRHSKYSFTGSTAVRQVGGQLFCPDEVQQAVLQRPPLSEGTVSVCRDASEFSSVIIKICSNDETRRGAEVDSLCHFKTGRRIDWPCLNCFSSILEYVRFLPLQVILKSS